MAVCSKNTSRKVCQLAKGFLCLLGKDWITTVSDLLQLPCSGDNHVLREGSRLTINAQLHRALLEDAAELGDISAKHQARVELLPGLLLQDRLLIRDPCLQVLVLKVLPLTVKNWQDIVLEARAELIKALVRQYLHGTGTDHVQHWAARVCLG